VIINIIVAYHYRDH